MALVLVLPRNALFRYMDALKLTLILVLLTPGFTQAQSLGDPTGAGRTGDYWQCFVPSNWCDAAASAASRSATAREACDYPREQRNASPNTPPQSIDLFDQLYIENNGDSARCTSTRPNGATGSQYRAIRFSCPEDHLFNEETKECYLSIDCDLPNVFVEGQCQPPPDTCVLNYDAANDAFGECVDIPTCTNDTGKKNYDPNFDFCSEARDECNTIGGTYGSVGNNAGEFQQVCIVNAGEGLPTCSSSGEVLMVDNPDGSYGFACETVVTPDHQCDATIFDCDGDGEVDDQDGDGCVDNGTTNGACVGSTGGQGTPGHTPGPGEQPGSATGQCDPTAVNYWDCITGGVGEGDGGGNEDVVDALGQGFGSLEEAITGIGETLEGEGTPGDKFATAEDYETTFNNSWTALQNVPIVVAAGNVQLTGAGSCPAPTFNIFDTNFTMDYHCTLYTNIAPVISAAMLAVWGVLAIRIFLSA